MTKPWDDPVVVYDNVPCAVIPLMLTCLYSMIIYCSTTRDYMVPSVWGVVPKGEDPYARGGCCVVM